MIDSSTLAAIGHVVASLGSGPATAIVLALVGLLLLPVTCAAAVLTWHGMRGTDPGPAAVHLLTLVAMVLPVGRHRGRRG